VYPRGCHYCKLKRVTI